ncbi:MAG: hypothetical protein WCP92_02055 [bacterium]
MHDDLNPKGKVLKTDVKSPVTIVFDETGSMDAFPKIFLDKAPMFHGQIEQQGYLKDFALSFCAIGDARNNEYAPLQVGDFEKGIKLDDILKKIELEGNGGGQQKETYELAAYYYLNHCEMPNADMPFLFFIGDEGFYSKIPKSILKEYLGEKDCEEQDSKKIFAELNKKFQNNVFLFHRSYGQPSVDREVVAQWKEILPPEHLIHMKDDKSIVDLMLGVIAMVSNARNLDAYTADMKNRGQNTQRIAAVSNALTPLSNTMSLVKVNDLPTLTGKDRKEGTTRNKK